MKLCDWCMLKKKHIKGNWVGISVSIDFEQRGVTVEAEHSLDLCGACRRKYLMAIEVLSSPKRIP